MLEIFVFICFVHPKCVIVTGAVECVCVCIAFFGKPALAIYTCNVIKCNTGAVLHSKVQTLIFSLC